MKEIATAACAVHAHLDFAPSGNLYVAEAGRGGAGPCFIGGEGPACMGATGAVTKSAGTAIETRIVDGLASYANDLVWDDTLEPGEADSGIGPHGITALSDKAVFVTSGGPTAPRDAEGNLLSRKDLAAENPAARLFGRLLWVYGKQRFVSVADIYDFERRRNPDGGEIDTNATDVLYDRGRFVISDAGGNSVLKAFGPHLSTLSVFPTAPKQNPFAPPGVLVDRRRKARRPLRDQPLAVARRRAGAQDPRMTSQARRTSSSDVRSEPIASRSTWARRTTRGLPSSQEIDPTRPAVDRSRGGSCGPSTASKGGRHMKVPHHPHHRLARALALGLGAAALAAPAASAHHQSRTDAVSTWNENAGKAAVAACLAPVRPSPAEARLYAMTHVAIHDALNAIDRRSRPYVFDGRSAARASRDAAVAAAARDVLVPVLRELTTLAPACVDAAVASVEADYAAALDAIRDGPAKTRGRRRRPAAADAILALRATDGADSCWSAIPPSRRTQPGEYRFTPGTPFAFAPELGRAHAVRAAATAPSSARARRRADRAAYTADFNEIKRLGGDGVTTPSARTRRPDRDRPVLGRELAAGVEPHRQDGRPQAPARPRGSRRACSACSTWRSPTATSGPSTTKYHYDYWRPVTAIQRPPRTATRTRGRPDLDPAAADTPDPGL